MRPVKSHATGQPYPITPTTRLHIGRRLRAARLLADVSLTQAAQAAGLTVTHVSAIERGREPLTSTDAVDLAAVLSVPADWLRHGWAEQHSDGGRPSV